MTEKELASEIFRRTRALNRIAQSFFHEGISLTEFDKLFHIGLADLSNVYRKFFLQKILDSLAREKIEG